MVNWIGEIQYQEVAKNEKPVVKFLAKRKDTKKPKKDEQ